MPQLFEESDDFLGTEKRTWKSYQRTREWYQFMNYSQLLPLKPTSLFLIPCERVNVVLSADWSIVSRWLIGWKSIERTTSFESNFGPQLYSTSLPLFFWVCVKDDITWHVTKQRKIRVSEELFSVTNIEPCILAREISNLTTHLVVRNARGFIGPLKTKNKYR